MDDIQKLIDMGFEKSKAEYALKMTNNKGVEPALEWLFANADEKVPREVGGASDAASSDTAANVRSFKCVDCGKIFSNEAEMQFHASKTNHSNFSETTEAKPPLSDEERQAQLAFIEETLKQKRLEREEHEKVDAQEREKNRIKIGKDIAEARQKMQELEMREIVEQRKRDKAEEKAARERVRAQIEADKAERKARDQRLNKTSTLSSLPSTSIPSDEVKSDTKDHTQTRLQIRLIDGTKITETFNIVSHLSNVRTFIEQKIGFELPFKLMTSFPRKVFDDEDNEKTLEELGLFPTAVLIMIKSPQPIGILPSVNQSFEEL